MSNSASDAAWRNDPQFQVTKITTVRRLDGDGGFYGWEVERDDGFWIGVPKDSPVEPKIGSVMRLYGKGFGYCVRGMVIDDQLVYYRTGSEDEFHRKQEMYGKDCADLIRKWDEGHAWSIELGGLGPGYEQVIQIMGFEMLRHLVTTAPEIDWDDNDAVKLVSDSAEAAIKPIIDKLRPSGGQFGAARNLALVFYRNGPVAAMEMADKDRHITVGPDFPTWRPNASTGPVGAEVW